MINHGNYTFESYALILNSDRTILKLNPTIERFGYKFLWIDASEFERDFSELVNVPKSNNRPLTIIIGREQHGISHELHNALVHTPPFGDRFMFMEYPGILLLKKLSDFNVTTDTNGFIIEYQEFSNFTSFARDLLLQLRLFKIGEIRYSQFFTITSESRQIALRKTEVSVGCTGDYTITDEEAEQLSKKLVVKYDSNGLTELATKNFSVVYDLTDVRIRFITLITCLESLFNHRNGQISHSIAHQLSLILSNTNEQYKSNYTEIKKLYNIRNSIVHGGQYNGDIISDYLRLSDLVRTAINYCNRTDLSKNQLVEEINARQPLN